MWPSPPAPITSAVDPGTSRDERALDRVVRREAGVGERRGVDRIEVRSGTRWRALGHEQQWRHAAVEAESAAFPAELGPVLAVVLHALQAAAAPSATPGAVDRDRLLPTRVRSRPAPTDSTHPAFSWPRVNGGSNGRTPGGNSCMRWRSEWQAPAPPIRTSTSPGPGSGSATSSELGFVLPRRQPQCAHVVLTFPSDRAGGSAAPAPRSGTLPLVEAPGHLVLVEGRRARRHHTDEVDSAGVTRRDVPGRREELVGAVVRPARVHHAVVAVALALADAGEERIVVMRARAPATRRRRRVDATVRRRPEPEPPHPGTSERCGCVRGPPHSRPGRRAGLARPGGCRVPPRAARPRACWSAGAPRARHPDGLRAGAGPRASGGGPLAVPGATRARQSP